jgi:O-antigen/teichoic acid export membrane protein
MRDTQDPVRHWMVNLHNFPSQVSGRAAAARTCINGLSPGHSRQTLCLRAARHGKGRLRAVSARWNNDEVQVAEAGSAEENGHSAVSVQTDGRSVRSRVASRAGWNLIDQAVSSLSNFGLSVVVARAVDIRHYGSFAVAYAVFTLLLGLERTLVSQPLSIRYTNSSPVVFRRHARRAAGSALLAGLVAAILVACVGGPLSGDSLSLFAIAVLMPGLFLQDSWRTIFICRGDPRKAAVNDAVWTVLMFPVLILMIHLGFSRPWELIAGWGVTGWIAAVFGVVQAKLFPELRKAWGWAWSHRALSGFLAAEQLSAYGSLQIALLIVAGLGGRADAGAFRGAQTLLGPMNMLALGGMAFVVPEFVRTKGLSTRGRIRAALAFSSILAAIDLAWGLLLNFIPTRLGTLALGDTWFRAHELIIPLTIGLAALAFALGPLTALQSIGRVREAFGVSMLLAPLLLVGTVAGLHFGGVRGAAWGMATAQWLVVPVWWRRLRQLPATPNESDVSEAAHDEAVGLDDTVFDPYPDVDPITLPNGAGARPWATAARAEHSGYVPMPAET